MNLIVSRRRCSRLFQLRFKLFRFLYVLEHSDSYLNPFYQAALKSQADNVELLGRQVDIDPNSGIFITLNPAGKGYGGRQKLPDNLKQVFQMFLS